MPDGSLCHGGLIDANGGEDKVNQEPRLLSKHQVVQTVPSNCRSGGTIGMCYFIEMRWLVGFLVFSQLPNHVHNCLVQSLYQPTSLGVVRHGPQSFYAKDLAHFLNNTTGEVSPLSLKSLARAPKIEMYPPYKNLAMVFAVWSGVTYTSMCFMKWSWNTKTLVTTGDLFGSIMGSMLVKSTCRRSKEAIATMGHKGAFGKPPSYWRQCVQTLIVCLICLAIPGHQKCSCSKGRVWSQPWCPTSWWHPSRAAVWCAFGTMKSSRSSFSPLDVEHKERAFWRVVKFWQFLHTTWPSLLEACSPMSVLRSVFFWAPSQFNMAFRTGSSFWAAAQSVMCISTCTHPVVTCTSYSTLWSPSTIEGSWLSALWAIPKATPSRMDFMASGSRQVVTWLRVSATVLSHPFWYSNWKLNLARAPSHQWPVASKLGLS